MLYKTTQSLFTVFIAVTGFISSAQIGVNTNEPTANLDVNGTLRVRSLQKPTTGFETDKTVIYIMGVDDKGNVIPIEIGENIILQNNKLEVELPATDPTPSGLPNGGTLSENYSDNKDAIINDLDLGIVILPGDRRGSWPIFRMDNGSNDEEVTITGFKAAQDGTIVYLYPTSGKIELKKNSSKSQSDNRIQIYNDLKIEKNGFVQLMYDGVIKKWLVVSSQAKSDDDD